MKGFKLKDVAKGSKKLRKFKKDKEEYPKKKGYCCPCK